MKSNITLEPVLVSELLVGPSVVVFDGTDPGNPVHNTMVEREVQDLWRMNLHPQGGVPAIQVDYEMTALNGANGFLSAVSVPASMMQCVVEKLPLSTHITPGVMQLRGSVRFHFDVTPATVSGAYGGTLLVTVNTL